MSLRRRVNRLAARTPALATAPDIVLLIVEPSSSGPMACGMLRLSDGLKIERLPKETEADLRARFDSKR